jgi:hypothetical protein
MTADRGDRGAEDGARNETVHYRRRPSPAPDAPVDPPRRSRLWTVAALAAAVAVASAGGYVVATRVGSGSEPRAAAGPTGAQRAPPPVPVRRAHAGDLPRTPTAGAAAGSGSPASFDAPIPTGWRRRELGTRRAGYSESRWEHPRDARTSVLVDWVDGDRAGSAAAAARLRAQVARRPGYREIRFRPARHHGWIWVYTILDEHGRRIARVDLLTHRCGVLFAVLGSSSPRGLARLRPTFAAISDGIRVRRRC